VTATPENRVKELNLDLPSPPRPVAKYKMAVQVGSVLYVSGHGPRKADGTMLSGQVGGELTLEQGKEAARLTGLNILSTLRDTLGSLDRVKRLVKTLALVNSAPGFADQPQVINGFSELMAEVFGDDAGVGARSAMGTSALPGNIPVEVECIVEVF
jgi:enamine deaminase RidA (YjgF/YER057c/UK114 family)